MIVAREIKIERGTGTGTGNATATATAIEETNEEVGKKTTIDWTTGTTPTAKTVVLALPNVLVMKKLVLLSLAKYQRMLQMLAHNSQPTVNNHVAAANTTATTVKSTKISSSATSAPTTTKAVVTTGKLASIFPVSGYFKSWSTSSLISNPLPLSDSTFRPTKEISTLTHSQVNAPD
ncbi:hypothetical protein H0H93_009310, partial [Arthromyces matolae]